MTQTLKISNKEVILILKEVLAAMEVKGLGFFEIRAYQNAIAVLDNTTSSIYDLWETGGLADVPGIGGSLIQHLGELFTKGKVKGLGYDSYGVQTLNPEGIHRKYGITLSGFDRCQSYPECNL